MGLESETSRLGLISSFVRDESSRHRYRSLTLLGGASIVFAVIFFVNLLIFAGLCFGYRDNISKCQKEVLIALLLLGVIQAILGLLSANKLLTLKSENSYDNYKLLMTSLMVVNSILCLLSASHTVTTIMVFLVEISPSSMLEGFDMEAIYATTIGLILLSSVHFFHSIVTMIVAACFAPSRQDSYLAKDNAADAADDA